MSDLVCCKDGVTYHFRREEGYLCLCRIEADEVGIRGIIRIPAYYNDLPVEQISMYGKLPKSIIAVHIPATVKSIFSGFNNSNVKMVSGCDGLENIYSAAFENSDLYNISLTNKLRLIADCAFLNCKNLYFVGDVSGVLVIGHKAFEGTALKSFNEAVNLYSIGDCAFRYCSNLKEFFVSSCLSNLGHNVFDYTPNITFQHSPASGNVMLLRERGILDNPEPIDTYEDCFEDGDFWGTEDYEIEFGWIDACQDDLIISFCAKAKEPRDMDMFIQNVYVDDVCYPKRQLRSFSNEWNDCIFEIPLNEPDNIYHISFDIGVILPHYRRQLLFNVEATIVYGDDSYDIIEEVTSIYNSNFKYISSRENNDIDEEDDDDDEEDNGNYYSDDEFDPSSWSEESYLKSKGYTVAQNVGLLEKERHNILSSVIDSGKMTKYQIINHLEAMINLRKYQSKYQTAIGKWERDIEFVRNYR